MGCFTNTLSITGALGSWMVFCGFSIKNDVNWYFTNVLEEQGQDVGNYIIPPTLFIVTGFLLVLLTAFFIVVVVSENRILFVWHSVLNGCTLVIQISALALLLMRGDSKGQMPKNTMLNSMDKYYIENNQTENIHVQFWNYLQTNVECCGIHGYTDWIAASQAPEVGFIPKSCCAGGNMGVENCTGAITKDNMNSLAFAEKFIFTEGCLAKNSESIYILLLKVFSGFGIFVQTFWILFGVYRCYYGTITSDDDSDDDESV